MKEGRNGIRRGVRKEFLGRGLGSWVLQNDSTNKGAAYNPNKKTAGNLKACS
jgi:hypothetical protein